MQPFERTETRDFDYKKGLTTEDARRKREDGLLDLRRTHRQEALAKRRNVHSTQSIIPNSSNDFDQSVLALDPSQIPILQQGINSDDIEKQYKCTMRLRKIISNKVKPPIDQVIRSGVVPKLIELLRCNNNEGLVFEAAWILTNVASGTSEHTAVLIQNNSVPLLVDLLRSPNLEIAEQVCWALGNIAGDKAEYRDVVLNNNAIDPLLSLYTKSKKESLIRTVTWTLSNMCRSKPEPNFQQIKKCIPYLSKILHSDDTEVVADAAWALSFICDENTAEHTKIQAVIDSGVVPRVMSLLLNTNQRKNVRMPMMRIIGNIVTGSNQQTQHILDNKGYEALESVLNCQTSSMRKEAVWTLSNIAAGTQSQMQSLVNSGLVKSIIDSSDSERYEVKKEIAWVLSNLVASGVESFSKYIVDNGGLRFLCDLLVTNDVHTVLVALEGISGLLNIGGNISSRENTINEWADYVEECGGLDKLEQIQSHENDAVYKKSADIIMQHFADEEDLAHIQPEEGDKAFMFG